MMHQSQPIHSLSISRTKSASSLMNCSIVHSQMSARGRRTSIVIVVSSSVPTPSRSTSPLSESFTPAIVIATPTAYAAMRAPGLAVQRYTNQTSA